MPRLCSRRRGAGVEKCNGLKLADSSGRGLRYQRQLAAARPSVDLLFNWQVAPSQRPRAGLAPIVEPPPQVRAACRPLRSRVAFGAPMTGTRGAQRDATASGADAPPA